MHTINLTLSESKKFNILQLLVILFLIVLPSNQITGRIVSILILAGILLMHSNFLIQKQVWNKYNIYNFILIAITIFYISAIGVFNYSVFLLLGMLLILANLVGAFIITRTNLKPNLSELKPVVDQKTALRINKLFDKPIYRIVALEGGTRFHSLDCQMIYDKKRPLKFYLSAHYAQKEGMKPCKLCKAVNYLHQL